MTTSIGRNLMWRADSLEKTLMLEKNWGQEEKGATEDEMEIGKSVV